MNAAVLQDFAEALQLVDGDRAAAANLALASALRESQSAGPPPEAALTVVEAARRMQIAQNTVYALVEQGKLKHHRIGRTIRILAADIDAYQQETTVQPAAPRKYKYL